MFSLLSRTNKYDRQTGRLVGWLSITMKLNEAKNTETKHFIVKQEKRHQISKNENTILHDKKKCQC
ncbi:hypothetical protein DERP_010592 [Dermatophagoides pteronyssinus]|uniref:Uncharacterized protein n=1 Tax=Dermatophagoides pteronyssinus TaxID=6956 RepID=A0ABQ8JGB7_DERPT|nr:hypothetical protein DERP_010592 [Dermatophagoides pteronyssinus]